MPEAPPRLGLRPRLFLASIALVAVFAATSGWWLSGQLRQILVQHVEDTLTAHARTLVQVLPRDAGTTQMQQLGNDFGLHAQARITIIRADGVVLTDSEADVSAMDNHGARPEVRAALAQDGFGRSTRYSQTRQKNMLYVAVAWPQHRPTGVVRVSRPLTQVESQVGQLTSVMWLAALGGLTLTVLLAAIFTQLVTRDLLRLTMRARELARGSPSGGDEIAWISGSIDRLSTELSNAVDDVADERNRLQAVLAGMREGVIALDERGRVRVTNPAAHDLLGLETSVLGLPLVQATGAPDLTILVHRSLDHDQPCSADINWSDSRDPTRDLALMVTATPQEGGGVVLVLHDVTELRRLAAVRRDFVSNASHELRTPVAVILSSAEALLDGAAGDPTHGPRFVAAIERHAKRLSLLISDLLDLGRLEGGKTAVAQRPVSLVEAVAEAVDSLAEQISKRGQHVSVQCPEDTTVLADAIALNQVLVNLLDNAIKYTPTEGHIAVSAEVDEEVVHLTIADDGPGIEAHHHARIFERFYRIDPGRSRDMGGTGLGLSIVRHLVEALEGQVSVAHNSPQGTRFTVSLPRARTTTG
jgi:two-component system phosphate regulon sensor histidine kinase PhoR